MKKIVTCGLIADSNFGSPSILHGIEEMLKAVLTEPYEIINYQRKPVVPLSVADLGFKTEQIATSLIGLLISGLLYKVGIPPFNKELKRQIKSIKEADYIIDLFGICFCDNFSNSKYSFYKTLKNILWQFPIPFIGKIFGVKTIKNISSFGPMEKKSGIKQARLAEKMAFDIFIAREKESQDVMIKTAKIRKPVYFAPDIANLMKCERSGDINKIGISISHQIIKQWKSTESYLSCIKSLCSHIIQKYGNKIILIPNEIGFTKYDDIHVAQDLLALLNDEDCMNVEVLDVENMNSSQLKNTIVSCKAIVASRYHTCVASLSGGVPLLVIGWHYKYSELLSFYEQSDWILTSEGCTTNKLVEKFDLFISQKSEIQQTIKEHQQKVKDLIISVYKAVFYGKE